MEATGARSFWRALLVVAYVAGSKWTILPTKGTWRVRGGSIFEGTMGRLRRDSNYFWEERQPARFEIRRVIVTREHVVPIIMT